MGISGPYRLISMVVSVVSAYQVQVIKPFLRTEASNLLDSHGRGTSRIYMNLGHGRASFWRDFS